MSSANNNKEDDGSNIKVIVRIRPPNQQELQRVSRGYPIVMSSTSTEVRVAATATTRERLYTYDTVLNGTSQQGVYSRVRPLLDNLLLGYSCSVLAYGVTGSGKTFSLGTSEGQTADAVNTITTYQNNPANTKPLTADSLDPHIGIVPRAVCDLYARLNQTCSNDYTVKLSFLEIYNEELLDLGTDDIKSGTALRILEDKGVTHINGLTETIATSPADALQLLARAVSRRHVAETKMNDKSSRSHFLFTITVNTREYEGSDEVYRHGMIRFVDLAGSESLGKTQAVGQQAVEAGKINASLLALSRVITAKVQNTLPPFRESKLTRILKQSFTQAETLFIAAVSPSSYPSFEEHVNTLEYAYRAKQIKNKPQINQKITQHVILSDLALRLREKEAEIATLKNSSMLSRQYDAKCQQYDQKVLELNEKRLELIQQRCENVIINDVLSIITKKNITNSKTLFILRSSLEQTMSTLLKTKYQLMQSDYIQDIMHKYNNDLQQEGNQLINNINDIVKDNYGLHSKIDRQFINEYNNLNLVNNYGIKTLESYIHLCTLLNNNNTYNEKFSADIFVNLCTKYNIDIDQLLNGLLQLTHNTATDLTQQLAQQQMNMLEKYKIITQALYDYKQLLTQHNVGLSNILQQSTDKHLELIQNYNTTVTNYQTDVVVKKDGIINDLNQHVEYIQQVINQQYQTLGDYNNVLYNDLHLPYFELMQKQRNPEQLALYSTQQQQSTTLLQNLNTTVQNHHGVVAKQHDELINKYNTDYEKQQQLNIAFNRQHEMQYKQQTEDINTISTDLQQYHNKVENSISQIDTTHQMYNDQHNMIYNQQILPLHQQINTYNNNISTTRHNNLNRHNNQFKQHQQEFIGRHNNYHNKNVDLTTTLKQTIAQFQTQMLSNMSKQRDVLLENVNTLVNTYVTTQQQQIQKDTDMFMNTLTTFLSQQNQQHDDLTQYNQNNIINPHEQYYQQQIELEQGYEQQFKSLQQQQYDNYNQHLTETQQYNTQHNTHITQFNGDNVQHYTDISTKTTELNANVTKYHQQNKRSLTNVNNHITEHYQTNKTTQEQYYNDYYKQQFTPHVAQNVEHCLKQMDVVYKTNVTHLNQNITQLDQYNAAVDAQYQTIQKAHVKFQPEMQHNVQVAQSKYTTYGKDVQNLSNNFKQTQTTQFNELNNTITNNNITQVDYVNNTMQPLTIDFIQQRNNDLLECAEQTENNTETNNNIITQNYIEQWPKDYSVIKQHVSRYTRDVITSVNQHAQSQLTVNNNITNNIQTLTTNLTTLTQKEVQPYKSTGATPVKRQYDYTVKLPSIEDKQTLLRKYENVVPFNDIVEECFDNDGNIDNDNLTSQNECSDGKDVDVTFDLDATTLGDDTIFEEPKIIQPQSKQQQFNNDMDGEEDNEDTFQYYNSLTELQDSKKEKNINNDDADTTGNDDEKDKYIIKLESTKDETLYNTLITETIQQQDDLYDKLVRETLKTATKDNDDDENGTPDVTAAPIVVVKEQDYTPEDDAKFKDIVNLDRVNTQRMVLLKEKEQNAIYIDPQKSTKILQKHQNIQQYIKDNQTPIADNHWGLIKDKVKGEIIDGIYIEEITPLSQTPEYLDIQKQLQQQDELKQKQIELIQQRKVTSSILESNNIENNNNNSNSTTMTPTDNAIAVIGMMCTPRKSMRTVSEVVASAMPSESLDVTLHIDLPEDDGEEGRDNNNNNDDVVCDDENTSQQQQQCYDDDAISTTSSIFNKQQQQQQYDTTDMLSTTSSSYNPQKYDQQQSNDDNDPDNMIMSSSSNVLNNTPSNESNTFSNNNNNNNNSHYSTSTHNNMQQQAPQQQQIQRYPSQQQTSNGSGMLQRQPSSARQQQQQPSQNRLATGSSSAMSTRPLASSTQPRIPLSQQQQMNPAPGQTRRIPTTQQPGITPRAAASGVPSQQQQQPSRLMKTTTSAQDNISQQTTSFGQKQMTSAIPTAQRRPLGTASSTSGLGAPTPRSATQQSSTQQPTMRPLIRK